MLHEIKTFFSLRTRNSHSNQFQLNFFPQAASAVEEIYAISLLSLSQHRPTRTTTTASSTPGSVSRLIYESNKRKYEIIFFRNKMEIMSGERAFNNG